jgi:hypothetical protein
LAIVVEDVLHIHGGQGNSEVTDELGPLCLPGIAREPGLHPAKVLAGAEQHGGEGDVGSLPDSYHHSPLMVLHQEKLPEVGFFCLVPRGHQLLLQRWQQDDEKIKSYGCQIG